MKLFAVLYLKSHIIGATLMAPGVTVDDCRKLSAQYIATLPSSPLVKSGKLKASDVREECEWHAQSPAK